MAETVLLKSHIAVIEFFSGLELYSPLLVPQVMWTQTSIDKLANSFGEALLREYIERAKYIDIFKYILPGDVEQSEISIEIPAQPNLYPSLTFPFAYIYAHLSHNHCIGFIPVLGIEAHGKSHEELESNLKKSIYAEFTRKKRLKSLRSIIATQWFNKVHSEKAEFALEFYTPNELRNLEQKRQTILTLVAEEMVFDEEVAFSVEEELEMLARTLRGKYRHSVLVIAAAGRGKTALIQEFSRRKKDFGIAAKIWQTTAAQLILQLTRDHGWQENLHRLCQELRERQDILYVRNFAELFEVGQYIGNNVSMGEYLFPYVQRGEILLLSECSEEEFTRVEVQVPGYLQILHTLRLQSLSLDKLQQVIWQKVQKIAAGQKIAIEQTIVTEVLRLQQRYTPYSGFPGKTIRFLESILLHKPLLTNINRTTVLQNFCEETGMPDFLIDPTIPLPLEEMTKFFRERLFGQDQAIDTITDLLASVKAALTRGGKPIASLLFVGPTGVGKTEMAKILADFAFSNRNKMIRFDMSEYADPYSVLRLTGEGAHQEGLLTAAIRQQPFSVVLFDELEKAHPSFYDLLLQILGEGRLSDARGKIADFCSTIVIMTSNIGARSYQQGNIGFREEYGDAISHFTQKIQKFFRPELFNRLDQIVVFTPLLKQTVRQIVSREIDQIQRRAGIRLRDIVFNIDEDALDYLCEKGYDILYGARQMQRTIHSLVTIPLAWKLNTYAFTTPLHIQIQKQSQALDIRVSARIEKQTDRDYDTEEIADFRRQLQRIEAGPFLTRLQSEMELFQQNFPGTPWQDQGDIQKRQLIEQYINKLQNDPQVTFDEIENYKKKRVLLEQFRNLYQEIEELEKLQALAWLKKQSPPQIDEEFAIWRELYKDFKIELCSSMNPESSKCLVAIYGPAEYLLRLANLYTQSIEKRTFIKNNSYKLSGITVWYREKVYTESIKKIEVKKRRKDRAEAAKWRKKAYIKRAIRSKDFSLCTPEKPGDKLVGIEMEFKGPCVELFFAGEEGLHVWKEDGNHYLYSITVLNDHGIREYTTPLEVHRSKFFKDKKEIRIYREDYLVDKLYEREIKLDNAVKSLPKNDIAEFMQIILEYKFLQALERSLE